MRYLHPVQRHEKFVASGRYMSYRDMPLFEDLLEEWQKEYSVRVQSLEYDLGEDGRVYRVLFPLSQIEEWSIHELPDRSRLIRCDRYSSRYPSEVSWLGEILRREDGTVERIDMRCYYEQKPTAEASYLFFDESVLIGRKYRQKDRTLTEREQTEMILPAGYLADSGMFTLTRGLTTRDMLKRQQATGADEFSVFCPEEPEYEDIETPFSLLLKGRILPCKINNGGAERIAVGKREIDGEVYQLTYAENFDGSGNQWTHTILIDRHGIPLSYPHDFAYTNRLEEYWHRPEPD